MHPFSTLTIGIFVAGYITARWDLVTRLYELAIFAWDHGVVARAAKGFAILSVLFFLFIIPIDRIAYQETVAVSSIQAIAVSVVPSNHRLASFKRISRNIGQRTTEEKGFLLSRAMLSWSPIMDSFGYSGRPMLSIDPIQEYS